MIIYLKEVLNHMNRNFTTIFIHKIHLKPKLTQSIPLIFIRHPPIPIITVIMTIKKVNTMSQIQNLIHLLNH